MSDRLAVLTELERQLQERARVLDLELSLHGDDRARLKSFRIEVARTALSLADVRNRIRKEVKNATAESGAI